LVSVGVIAPLAQEAADVSIARVLLISIDGLHAVDLRRYVAMNPGSALAQLSAVGRTYTNASATRPSDSFPGLLAMVTGGRPLSTGVYYDDGWDRTLAAASGACVPGSRVRWKQNLDATPTTFATWEAYSTFWTSLPPDGAPVDPLQRLNATLLPRTPADGCISRVYPHQFPRGNNVFELVKEMGGRTAWADKHPAYEFLMGSSGTAIDDLYTPEIATSITSPAPVPPLTAVITDSFELTTKNDDLKVEAILNEIKGLDHLGNNAVGVPTLFGMNFQAVSVGQKLDMSPAGGQKGGYLDAAATPSAPLQAALDHVDASIGKMVAALSDQGLLDSTLIIISAKHGNSPIDPSTLQRVDPATISTIVNLVPPGGLLALLSADTGPLIWLKDPTKGWDVVAALDADRTGANVTRTAAIIPLFALTAIYPDPLTKARAPDIILVPKLGTVYTTSATKIADHGGLTEDDVHVGLLVSNSRMTRRTINNWVETRQIACTILTALQIPCDRLTSEQVEPSTKLPSF
jgi:hypothetical protein